jgi:hypothetical protein
MNNNKTTPYYELATITKVVFMTVTFLITAILLFIENWLLMIFIGTLHSVFDFIPALGFWTVFWFNLLIGIILGVFKRGKFNV